MLTVTLSLIKSLHGHVLLLNLSRWAELVVVFSGSGTRDKAADRFCVAPLEVTVHKPAPLHNLRVVKFVGLSRLLK